MLADFGADVIRIDRVGGSEDRFVAPVTSEGEGAFFLQVNRNKRSITLNLDSEEGRAVVRKLLLTTDVVVANMPPRTIAALGLDYESLRKVKPDIILTASSAFGADPVVRDRVGFDGVGQAMSGAVHLTGLPDHPMKSMVPVVDFSTALCCALGTMMALYERKASGRGQEVRASLLHTALTLSSGSLIEEALRGLNRQATVNRSPTYGPSDIFRVKDGWIIAQVIGPAMFKRWTRMVDRPELLDDPRFRTMRCAANMAKSSATSCRTGAPAARARKRWPCWRKRAFPAVPSTRRARRWRTTSSALPARFTAWTIQGRRADTARRHAGVAVAYRAGYRARPPTAGEHTEEVLRDAGYAPGEIAGLRERGVI